MSASTNAIWITLASICVAGLAWAQENGNAAEPRPGEVATTRPDGMADVKDLPALDRAQPAQVVGRITGGQVNWDDLLRHLPDPDDCRADALQKAEDTQKIEPAPGVDPRAEQIYYRNLATHLEAVGRPRKLPLRLSDALHRALANSFAIRVESYNPAIGQTHVVEAEAAFDATFFGTLTKNIQNVPTASVLQGSNVDIFTTEGGIRQLLPTGMTVSTSLTLDRTSNDSQFQTINPQYNSSFNVDFRQPLLRGFGLDFNRSRIEVAKNDKRISDHAFVRQVQDTLRSVETAYWRLYQARRAVAIQARLLSKFEQIYRWLVERGTFDALPVQIGDTRARLESARSTYIRLCNEVRNAEDALIALMNDPQINLAESVEIVPVDRPAIDPIVLDQLAEIQSALDHRPEIAEAKLRIASARILVGAAKNQALPQLDLLFRYTVDGLGVSADAAFDEVTKNDFHEYVIGVNLELPVGNRARRAAERRARLQHAQSIAALKAVFEQVILDVNARVREMLTQFNQITPNYDSAVASQAQVRSLMARADAMNYIELNNELSAFQGFALNLNDLLRSIAGYNIAIIELERAKGTLLDYYNVAVPTRE